MSTGPDRDELLSQLISLPPTEREGLLREQCRDHPHLETEIRSLLRVHDSHAHAFRLDESSALPGTIGRYPILQVLGRGGMGTVYLAIDPELDRKIAIKVVPRELSTHLSVERLRQEARLLASVSHPNLAIVYSLETAEDRTFLTLELVTGSTLAESMRDGPLPVREALIVFRQIASAVAAIHRRRIVHRDLSPGNVCITDGGLVKVLDFGLSTLVFEAGQRRVGQPTSLPNQILGTPGYMSPELIRGLKPDHRTDLWSFGCLLYEALTGVGPFRCANVADTLAKTLKEEADPALLPADLPETVRELIEGCLRKEVSQRHDSMEAAIAILERPLAPSPARHPGRIMERQNSTNLPRPLSSFVGRKSELAQVKDAIALGGLITLKGLGGAGKTRLAIESAGTATEQFLDGVWFVAVAPLTSESQLVTELAKTLGVREQPREELRETVVSHLRSLQTLLVLDNAEHLLREVATLAFDILSAAPRVVILATSRQSLGLAGERIIPVPPFPIPGTGNDDEPAVQLFIERAAEIRPDLTVSEAGRTIIADICRHLDGLPLAIELAAVRTRSLPLSEIATRLRDRFSLLAQRNPMANPHHQTLGLSMDHSYELLSTEERTLFRRLAVFPETWSLSAAETICAEENLPSWRVLDLLDALMDHSLVEADSRAESEQHRYRMLETVREYAVRQLDASDESVRLRRRHRDFYLQLVEECMLVTELRPEPDWTVLDAERRNLDLALATSLEDPDPIPALRLTTHLGRYWLIRSNWRTGLAMLHQTIDRVRPLTAARHLLPRAIMAAGRLASNLDDHNLARDCFQEALAIAATIEEPPMNRVIASCHSNLGLVESRLGNYDRATEYFGRGVEAHRQNHDVINEARALLNLTSMLAERGDIAGAIQRYEEIIRIFRRVGDIAGTAVSLHNMGAFLHSQGRLPESRRYLQEALEIRRGIKEPYGIATTLSVLGEIDLDEGQSDAAREHLREAVAVGVGAGTANVRFLADLLRVLARLANLKEAPALAIELLSCAHRIGEDNFPSRMEQLRSTSEGPLTRGRAALSEQDAAAAWDLGQAVTDPVARLQSAMAQLDCGVES